MEELIADLLANGYVEVDVHPIRPDLRAGVRVRHSGEQYPEAYRDGTATVVRVFHNPKSSWVAAEWRSLDVEVLVHRDKPLFDGMSLDTTWADYHTRVVS